MSSVSHHSTTKDIKRVCMSSCLKTQHIFQTLSAISLVQLSPTCCSSGNTCSSSSAASRRSTGALLFFCLQAYRHASRKAASSTKFCMSATTAAAMASFCLLTLSFMRRYTPSSALKNRTSRCSTDSGGMPPNGTNEPSSLYMYRKPLCTLTCLSPSTIQNTAAASANIILSERFLSET